jgi:hypothetical protein
MGQNKHTTPLYSKTKKSKLNIIQIMISNRINQISKRKKKTKNLMLIKKRVLQLQLQLSNLSPKL